MEAALPISANRVGKPEDYKYSQQVIIILSEKDILHRVCMMVMLPSSDVHNSHVLQTRAI